MKSFLSLCLLLFTAIAFAGPQEAGKPEEACEKQHAQCMKQCDKEKTAWFFKGEAYDSCATKCEARHSSCEATGTGDAVRDDAGRRGSGQADAARERSDSEDQPQAEEIPEAGDDESDAAGDKGKGKDRAGGRGGKDKDRDAEDDNGAEGDE